MKRLVRQVARHVSIGLALALPLAASEGRTEPPRIDDISSYSPYEQETARIGLQRTGATLDTAPEGKIIEGVDVVTLEVFEKRDPIPLVLNGLVNWFHVTTKPHFVRRELLFKPGDRYERRIIEESARNLRGLSQLTVVILLPTQGSAPDRVRMLLVTKDLWSLRIPVEYRLTSSGAFEYVSAQVTEINLAGTHHQISANVTYDPNTVSFGGSFIVPRIFDSRLRFVVDANPIYNYRTNQLEGTFGSVTYTLPLFSLATEWAYGARIGWSTGITRRYIASDVSVYDANSDLCVRPDQLSEGGGGIPCQFSRDRQAGRIFLTRSFGRILKQNLTVAAEATRDVYRSPELAGYDPGLAAKFLERVPPLSDTRLGGELQYQTFSATFMRVLDFERLGLQEEFQLGHNLILKVSPAYAPLRDSRFVVGVFAGASYTVPIGDGIARAFVESRTDFEPERIPDASIDVGARIMSPRTGIGRLVFDARMLHRYQNYLNDISALGGDTRLRGYPSSQFRGKDLVVLNAEYRSRPLEILKAQLGGVLFFDSGAAFDGFSNLRFGADPDRPAAPRLQATGGLAAGFGARLFLPQVNRIVIRADWGFPLAAGYRERDAFPGELTITFGQAFPMPAVPIAGATTQ